MSIFWYISPIFHTLNFGKQNYFYWTDLQKFLYHYKFSCTRTELDSMAAKIKENFQLKTTIYDNDKNYTDWYTY